MPNEPGTRFADLVKHHRHALRLAIWDDAPNGAAVAASVRCDTCNADVVYAPLSDHAIDLPERDG